MTEFSYDQRGHSTRRFWMSPSLSCWGGQYEWFLHFRLLN